MWFSLMLAVAGNGPPPRLLQSFPTRPSPALVARWLVLYCWLWVVRVLQIIWVAWALYDLWVLWILRVLYTVRAVWVLRMVRMILCVLRLLWVLRGTLCTLAGSDILGASGDFGYCG